VYSTVDFGIEGDMDAILYPLGHKVVYSETQTLWGPWMFLAVIAQESAWSGR
jgi:hypothetical protein